MIGSRTDHTFVAGCLGVILGTCGASAQEPSKVSAERDPPAKTLDLTEANYLALRDCILPKAEELRWQRIPWRPTWAEALGAARKENKLIYVWAMNGHPLGNC